MLIHLSDYLNKKIIKILLVTFLLGFVLLGSGIVWQDMMGVKGNIAAKVGSKEVTMPELQNAIKQRAELYYSLTGKQLSQEEIMNPDAIMASLQTMINRRLIELEAKAQNFIVTPEMIKLSLNNSKFFKDENGNFSSTKLEEFLKSQNLTEEYFISTWHYNLQQELLSKMLSNIYIFPPEIFDMLTKAYFAKHQLQYYYIKNDSIEITEQPSDEELTIIRNNNIDKFTIPEKHTISYIKFAEENLNYDNNVSAEEIKSYYEENIESYTEPEKRQLSQAVFDNKKEAEDFINLFHQSNSFTTASKNLNKQNIDTSWVSKGNLPPDIEKTIFSLAKNEISEPYKTPLGWHVWYIANITQAQTKPLPQVKEQVKTSIMGIRKLDALNNLAINIDKEVQNEKSLEEISQIFNLPIQSKALETAIEEDKVLLDASQKLQEKQMEFINYDEDSKAYYVLRLDTVEPETTQDIAAVKDTLNSIWLQDKQKLIAGNKLASLSELLKNKAMPKEIDNFLKQNKITKIDNITLSYAKNVEAGKTSCLNSDIYFKLLEVYNHSISSILENDAEKCQVVANVSNIELATISKEEENTIKSKIMSSIVNGNQSVLLEQFINYLKTKYKVKINNSLLESIQIEQ